MVTMEDYRVILAERQQTEIERISTGVLERALLDIGMMGDLRTQAMAWINNDQDWLFSFREVCGHVGLDPDAVRGQMNAQELNRKRRLIRRTAGQSTQQRVMPPRTREPR